MCIDIGLIQKTGTRTESYIIIHTWDGFPCFFCNRESIAKLRKLYPTVTYLKYFFQYSNRGLNGRDIRSEILTPIRYSLSSFYEFSNGRVWDLDVGKIFIIFHENIILRRKMFYEVCLENKCLHLTFTEKYLDISDFYDHLSLSDSKFLSFLKIRIDSQEEIFCFSYVDHFSRMIFHLIDSWSLWKIFQKILEMFSNLNVHKNIL